MLPLTAILLVLIGLAVPVAIALGLSVLIYVLVTDARVDPFTLFRAFFSFLDSYTLMAIPFFIFAGFLMEQTGLVKSLFYFADELVGWLPGGFGFATVVACIIFAAISGSSTAMAAAMGVIAYPEMIRRGYPKWLAAGVIASAGGIAMLIPPSIVLILFGVVSDTSIRELFFAGVIPGLGLAIADMVVIAVCALIFKLPRRQFRFRQLMLRTKEALPALVMPIFILGGLYGGIFTPTEAGAASCAYAVAYGLISGRRSFLQNVLPTARRSMNLTAIIFLLMGCVGIFQFLLANEAWPARLARPVLEADISAFMFLVLMLPVLLLLSCFLTATALVVLTVPVIFPIASALGIDPIVLGILVVVVGEMGVITPPVGLNLFAVAGTTNLQLPVVIRGAIPFFIMDGTVLVTVLFFPEVATWLPDQLIEPVFEPPS